MTSPPPSPTQSPTTLAGRRRAVPGLAACLVVGALAVACSRAVPAASPALVAIVLGVVATNTPVLRGRREEALRPGIALSAKTVLRIGIVLLGLQLAISDVLGLGAVTLLVVVAAVALGMGAGLLLGRLLRVPFAQTVLIACGFSICGAAAVAAANGALAAAQPKRDDGDEDGSVSLETQTATAIALVVVFGTLMIPLVPILSAVLGLGPAAAGTWAGASILEVAQVVAAGGLMGDAELTTAVVVKLARVLLLAPVIALLSIGLVRAARRSAAADPGASAGEMARPTLVPAFVIGFLVAVGIRSLGVLPEQLLDAADVLQSVLIAAAMFALGTNVKAALLRQIGGRPVLLAAVLAVVMVAAGLGGALLVV